MRFLPLAVLLALSCGHKKAADDCAPFFDKNDSCSVVKKNDRSVLRCPDGTEYPLPEEKSECKTTETEGGVLVTCGSSSTFYPSNTTKVVVRNEVDSSSSTEVDTSNETEVHTSSSAGDGNNKNK